MGAIYYASLHIIYLPHFLVTFYLLAIMLHFFHSNFYTKHKIFSPFFSSPHVILYIFCYPFPPSLTNPIVITQYTAKILFLILFFLPSFSFSSFSFLYFIFTPLIFHWHCHFFPPKPWRAVFFTILG